jgi:benzodiazapine receptor
MADSDDPQIASVVEIFLSFLGPVFLIGLAPAMIYRSRRQMQTYEDIRAKVSIAPPMWVYGPVWILLYFIMSLGGTFVRVLGGMYIAGVNLQPLIYFWILQVVLSLYTVLFFGMNQRVLAMLIVFASLVLAVIVGLLFWSISIAAAVFMFIVSLWLFYAFVLSIAILRADMSQTAARAVNWLNKPRSRSVEEGNVENVEASMEQRKRRAQRSKSASSARQQL